MKTLILFTLFWSTHSYSSNLDYWDFPKGAHQTKWSLQLIADEVANDEVAPEFELDLDGDKIIDRIEYTPSGTPPPTLFEIKIELSSGGSFYHAFGEHLHELFLKAVDLNGDGSYPSLMVAYRGSGGAPIERVQHMIFNHKGKLSWKPLGINIAARGVDCAQTKQGAACHFASYFSQNKTLLISPKGKVQDISSTSGLPFPTPGYKKVLHQFLNGVYMMGAAFFDFDIDGIKDLIVVGQHSDVLFARGRDSSLRSFEDVQYVDATGEYMRVFALPLKPGIRTPRCVHFTVEWARGPGDNESRFPDYLRCFQPDGKSSYTIGLDNSNIVTANNASRGARSHYQIPRYFDYDGDGLLDITVRASAQEKWRVFQFVPVADVRAPGALVVAHSNLCVQTTKVPLYVDPPGWKDVAPLRLEFPGISQQVCSKNPSQSWVFEPSPANSNQVLIKTPGPQPHCLDGFTEFSPIEPPDTATPEKRSLYYFFSMNPVRLEKSCDPSQKSQLWEIIPTHNSRFRLKNMESQLCLGVFFEAPEAGAVLSEVECGNVGNTDPSLPSYMTNSLSKEFTR